MNKLRDCAIVLGLAGMLLMVSADTKDVKATGKISYESETILEHTFMTAGMKTVDFMESAVSRLQEQKEDGIEEAAAEMPGQARAAEESGPAEQMEAAETPEQLETLEQAEVPEQMEPAEQIEAEPAVVEEAAPEWIYEVSEEDYDSLLRLVEAEASGEDIKGKILVANVVLNRVASSAFPDTIKEVIYQKQNGRAQFSPVATGKIDRVTVSDETVEAVNRALCGEDESEGALYFVAPACASAENHGWFKQNLTLLFSYNGHEFYT